MENLLFFYPTLMACWLLVMT